MNAFFQEIFYKIDILFHKQLIRFIPRPAIYNLKNRKNIIGVEIGTRYGYNAENIMKLLDIKELFCIDPYISYDIFTKEKQDIIFEKANKIIGRNPRINLIKKKSEDALSDIPDNVDFVYIDGLHTYEQVYWEIKNYYKKLKKGGVMCGHDFNADLSGVAKAVIQFADEKNKRIRGFKNDWWFEK